VRRYYRHRHHQDHQSIIIIIILSSYGPSQAKPAALPLMDSGRLTRSENYHIDLTKFRTSIAGGVSRRLSARTRSQRIVLRKQRHRVGYSTGVELVCDELREAATRLTQHRPLKEAVEEAVEDVEFGKRIGT
jgi:hypothetical protein